jgi:hypothetical protein
VKSYDTGFEEGPAQGFHVALGIHQQEDLCGLHLVQFQLISEFQGAFDKILIQLVFGIVNFDLSCSRDGGLVSNGSAACLVCLSKG